MCPSRAPSRPSPPVPSPMSPFLWLLRDLSVPEQRVRKVWIHVEICQSIVGFSSWSVLGCEKQPKSLSHRGIEMWTDGQMGRQLFAWAARKLLPWPGLEERLEDRKGGRELPWPGSQGQAASTHHTSVAGSILGTKEKGPDPLGYLVRTALGKTTKETFLV